LHFLVSLVGKEHAHTLLTYAKSKYPSHSKQLEYLLTSLSTAHLTDHPWTSYLRYLITERSLKIERLSEHSLLNKQTKHFLNFVLSFDQEGDVNDDYVIMLRDIKRSLKVKDTNQLQSFKIWYLLLKSVTQQ
jgi:hypothetical protein